MTSCIHYPVCDVLYVSNLYSYLSQSMASLCCVCVCVVVCLFSQLFPLGAINKNAIAMASLSASSSNASVVTPLRPVLFLHGKSGLGQSQLAAALLTELDEYALFSIDLPSLLGDTNSRSAEETLLRVIGEARRNAPAILFWPHVDLWWDTAPPTLKMALMMLLNDIPETTPLFLLATADADMSNLASSSATSVTSSSSSSSTVEPQSVDSGQQLFQSILFTASPSRVQFELHPPTRAQRASFFEHTFKQLCAVLSTCTIKPSLDDLTELSPAAVRPAVFPSSTAAATSLSSLALPVPRADPAKPLGSATAVSAEDEANALRIQRMFLRSTLDRLIHQFPLFAEPVDRSVSAWFCWIFWFPLLLFLCVFFLYTVKPSPSIFE